MKARIIALSCLFMIGILTFLLRNRLPGLPRFIGKITLMMVAVVVCQKAGIRLGDKLGYKTSERLKEKNAAEAEKIKKTRSWVKQNPVIVRKFFAITTLLYLNGLFVILNFPSQHLLPNGRFQVDPIPLQFRYLGMASLTVLANSMFAWSGYNWVRTRLGRIAHIMLALVGVIVCMCLPAFGGTWVSHVFVFYISIELIIPLVYFFAFNRWVRAQAINNSLPLR